MRPQQESQRAPMGVLFDSSLGGDIDQVLALAMLFNVQATRRIRISSISTGAFNLKKAAFLDAVARFYGGGGDGYGPGRRMLPVGMATSGAESDFVPPMIASVLEKVGDDGGPAYPHTITHLNDTADPGAVIRNALSALEDQNATVILAGAPTNLLSFLDLPDGALWAERKATMLCIAGGRFDGGDPDPLIRSDTAEFRRLLLEWPTPIVMVGGELNALAPAGPLVGESESTDPVADAYWVFTSGSRDVTTRALAAVVYATGLDTEESLETSPPGSVAIEDDGHTSFAPAEGGTHRCLTVRPDHQERLLRTYTALLAAPETEER